ncbi:MAG TPA: hypothetical protein VEJ87_00595, partial [Acidimicrobiales bacterium]|nr:hypothetical protein [Acidimicrobiales bacterium]
MSIEAVVFDIGGVLEMTPATGWQKRWAVALGITLVELNDRLDEMWLDGSLGRMSLEELEHCTAQALGLDEAKLRAFMADLWSEYLGSLNEELATYFISLRRQFRTGILSNSFVGAREREKDRYGFKDICDVVVYSHEEGTAKPDP